MVYLEKMIKDVSLMQSERLNSKGVKLFIAGSAYNFRYQTAGEKVKTDMNRILDILDVQPEEIYTGQQTHSATVAYADGKNGEAFVFGRTFKDTDGLLTDKKKVGLLIKYADCTPIVLYDPVNDVLAVVHSGWRGTVQRISEQAIVRMETEFNSKRENLLAFVGPSIDQANYEVGPEVYEAFSDFPERDSFFQPADDKYKLSMTDANLVSLTESGIKESNIEVDRRSTYTDERLHSARKEGTDYQLNGLFVMMD